MKRFVLLSCVALCGCMMRPEAQTQYYAPAPAAAPVYDYNTGVVPVQPVPYAGSVQAQNPYALEPPAYEEGNVAILRKEQEIFEKEKALLNAQQELYQREKTLANREADFYNRSKALSYKEQVMMDKTMNTRPSYMDEPRGYATNVYRPPMPAPAPEPIAMGRPTPSGYSEPADNSVTTADFIIMQHPVQRDLVRCPATDDVCLQSYERLGYVRANNLSRFTAEDEVISEGAYPAGQWRNDNTIPRW